MSARVNVGILGIGTFLPPVVRTNDWWPRSIVADWERKAVLSKNRMADEAALRPGERKVLEAMRELADDPFRGSVERRVMPEGMKSSDMEIASARQAIERSGLRPDQIEFVITYSFCPDELLCPNAFVLHQSLGLPRNCFTTGVEAACNSFLVALTLAHRLVSSGSARNGLVVQSCGVSRLLPQEDPSSAWFGDGAASVVVGEVKNGGIISDATLTDSSLHPAVVTGIAGRAWYEEGRSYFYAKDRASAFRIMLSVADNGKEVIDLALERAGLRAADIDFFACHQISPWMRRTVQDFAGMKNARSVETFQFVGNLASVNVPLVLDMGEREGMLRAGDTVLLYGGGAGITYSATVMRWGH